MTLKIKFNKQGTFKTKYGITTVTDKKLWGKKVILNYT